MARIPKTKVYNPQKASAYVGKGVLKAGGNITPVPNGPLVKKKGEFKGSTLKSGGKVKLTAGGEKHVIYKKTSATGVGKGKKGNIMVNHPTTDKGKWDTIDLTQKAKAKTVAQGVAATKKWHKDNPKMKNGGSTPAWQRKEGKNPEGGLNAKGRASYNRANPGKPGLKAPQPEGGSRKKSFCARMSGMKKKLTSSKTANDPNSRINKSLRKWKC
jgi:hypothetical protein